MPGKKMKTLIIVFNKLQLFFKISKNSKTFQILAEALVSRLPFSWHQISRNLRAPCLVVPLTLVQTGLG